MNPSKLLVSAALGAPSLCLAQNLVTNGDFEEPVVGSGWAQRLPGTTFGSWLVDNVGQGVVQVASFGNPAAFSGSQCVELNFYVPCGISQTIATRPGRRYVLSFLMAGQLNAGPDVKVMDVFWNGALVDAASWSRSGSGGRWERRTYSVVASADLTTVHFFGTTSVDGGPYLDLVTVFEACGADFNGDLQADFFDYLDFVAALDAEELSADINGDQQVDFFDYLDFAALYDAGCD